MRCQIGLGFGMYEFFECVHVLMMIFQVLFCADLRVVPGTEAKNSGRENESESKPKIPKPELETDERKVKRKISSFKYSSWYWT